MPRVPVDVLLYHARVSSGRKKRRLLEDTYLGVEQKAYLAHDLKLQKSYSHEQDAEQGGNSK